MKMIGILLKRELNERITNIKNTKKDIAGTILNVFLTMFIIGVFVFAFSYFTETYANIQIGYITNNYERVYEILTILVALLLGILAVIGITRLNKSLIEVSNVTLLSMPITPFQIFISKLIIVYIELSLTSLAVSLPAFILLSIKGFIAWYVVLISIIFSILLPIIALAVASIFTIPFYFAKQWLNKHVIVQLIVYIIFMIGAFAVYSIFLRFIKGLIDNGQISRFFNETNVYRIGNLCKYLVPANMFSAIIMGKNLLLNISLALLTVGAGAVICFYVSKFIFTLVRQNKIGTRKELVLKRKERAPRNTTFSLITKEYLNVLRTPSYAFNYFAIVLSLPFMVVITSGIMSSMMRELTFLNCDFEIVFCSVCMYSILLNTFCANNISRDGKFFNLIKTYPLSPKKVVFSKIWFCAITSFISILFSGVAVLITGLISPLKTLAVVGICCILNFGIICIATRKDLNTTKHKLGDENPASVNFLIFFGLIISVAMTIVSFLFSLYLQTKYSLLVSSVFNCLVLLSGSLVVLVISLFYLLTKLDKKFKEIVL